MHGLSYFISAAEEVAVKHGDLKLFQRDYQEMRQRLGIKESIKESLKKQNLPNVFPTKD
jgi:hypothetical protein